MPDETKSSRLSAALAAIDRANALDPHRIDGTPGELLYSRRMTAWLARLYPGAPDLLKLAVRAQHIQRWTIPRSTYPMTKQGYHRWRAELAKFHAQTAGAILRDAGYDAQEIARVGALLRKEKLKSDAEAQALEDVACLVFLQYEFADFAGKHEEEKVMGILRRTWAKMSPVGHAAALALELPDSMRQLIQRALA